MRLNRNLPELTDVEASRQWMTARDTCLLANVGNPDHDPSVKRLLNNLSDRGHMPCIKSGSGKTAPRLYSLAGVAMLRTFNEMVATGRTYVYAQPVAEKVAELLVEAVSESVDLIDLEQRFYDCRIVYGGIRKGRGADTPEGTPRIVRVFRGRVPDDLIYLDLGVFSAGIVVHGAVSAYADAWQLEREGR